MSEKTLEEQQRDFDAWKANLPVHEMPATPKAKSKERWAPVKKTGRFAESFYVHFLQVLGFFCLFGAVAVWFLDAAQQIKIVMFLSFLISGVLWSAGAHALRLLEQLHWERKK